MELNRLRFTDPRAGGPAGARGGGLSPALLASAVPAGIVIGALT